MALAPALTLSGCSGFGGGSGSGGGDSGSLTFTTWASKSEETSFTELVKKFESEHKGVTVKLNVVPYQQMFSNIDAQLSSADAPDIFRVDYGNLGVYSSQNQLLDLSTYFDKDEIATFNPAMWQAISYDGKPYGVPHQTDVSALLVNTDLLTQAGISVDSLPKTQNDAWTWDRFSGVAAKLRASLPNDKYPFVYNWQQAGAPRWLSWLFQAGGNLIASDGKTPAIDSAEGAKALDFTKSFFEKNWVPPTSSVKSPTYADSLFSEGTAAMGFLGSFLVPDLASLAKFKLDSHPTAHRQARSHRPWWKSARGHQGNQKPQAGRHVPEVHGAGRQHVHLLRRHQRVANAHRPEWRQDRIPGAQGCDASVCRPSRNHPTQRCEAADIARNVSD